MQSALFAVLGFATAAYSASIPRDVSPLKPFEITGLNFTQAAGSDAANVRFWLNDTNTGDYTICGDEGARPNELRFCNGSPLYVFGEDFKTLSVVVQWWPQGFQNHTAASGKADIQLDCVGDAAEKQCHAENLSLKIEPTIVA